MFISLLRKGKINIMNYKPTGSIRLHIDTTHVDNDGFLLEETEDEKILYDIMRKGKQFDKTIILTLENGSGGAKLSGIPLIQKQSLTLTDALFNGEGECELLTQFKIGWTGTYLEPEFTEI